MVKALTAIGLFAAFTLGTAEESASFQHWIASPPATDVGYKPPIVFKPDARDPFIADAELSFLFEQELVPKETEPVEMLIADEEREFSFGGFSPNR